MINRLTLTTLLITLYLPAAAQVGTIKEIPDPKGGYPTSLYIGRYGETIELTHDWTVEPRMRDEVEVVRFHAKHTDQWERHSYRPVESEYKPENFTPMGLMQLIVIPKNVPGGMRSLKDMRTAKEIELKRSGVDYEIIEETNDSRWPTGTLFVLIDKPYRLRQIYAESPKQFFILTMAGKLEKGYPGLTEFQVEDIPYAQGKASSSLGDYLLGVSRAPVQSTDCDWFHYFRTTDRFWKILGAFSLAMLALAFWPGATPRARKIHLFGASLLSFTLLSGMAGFLAIFLPGQYGVYGHIDGPSALIPAVLFPLISWIAAKCLGSSRPNRILAWSTALAVLWAVFLYQPQGEAPGDARVFLSTSIFLLAGLTFGIAFSLAFGPLPERVPP